MPHYAIKWAVETSNNMVNLSEHGKELGTWFSSAEIVVNAHVLGCLNWQINMVFWDSTVRYYR